MEKYIKDGKVGVLVSSGYGAGWSTWNDINWALDKRVVEKFISDDANMNEKDWDEFMKTIGMEGYCGGCYDLELIMVDKGSIIKISEFNGSEELQINTEGFMQV